jgi:hypothetical protein
MYRFKVPRSFGARVRISSSSHSFFALDTMLTCAWFWGRAFESLRLHSLFALDAIDAHRLFLGFEVINCELEDIVQCIDVL